MNNFDPIETGRFLVQLGHALLEGRLQLVNTIGIPSLLGDQVARRDISHDRTNVSQDTITREPVIRQDFAPERRPGARGVWTARKGYRLAKGKIGDSSGITPAGFRLIEYVKGHPDQSATTIAGELGLSRKTVENLLSLLRQRSIIETHDLK